ncbi:MAG: beta-galactosidase [Candidatus Hydrogenedentota bacterium]
MRYSAFPAVLCLIVGGAFSAQAAEVTVVGDTCVRIDGKPFFPIGVYSAGNPKDLPLLAEAGFNTVHTYAWEGGRAPDNGKAWLDAAHANGLMCLVGLYRPDVKAMEFQDSIRRIETYRDHPALLAWHTMDEPAWDKEGDQGKDYMPAAYEVIKEHDPHHPVTAVVCHFVDPQRFEASMDVCQADYYPVPPIPAEWYSGTGFRGVRMFCEKWREASGSAKPFWYVGQIFDFSVSKESKHDIPDEWKRLPTGDELRCMTYTAVASGARGILYWSLSRLIGDEWNRTLLGRVRLWEDLKGVVEELNALMPVLTADTPESLQVAGTVAAMVKSDANDTYIILANYERRPAEAQIQVPGVTDGEAEGVFHQGTAPVTDGALAVSLAPIESRVYRLAGTGDAEDSNDG